MKSLNELENLGSIMDNSELEKIDGGKNWMNSKWYKDLMKDLVIGSNAYEAAFGGYYR